YRRASVDGRRGLRRRWLGGGRGCADCAEGPLGQEPLGGRQPGWGHFAGSPDRAVGLGRWAGPLGWATWMGGRRGGAALPRPDQPGGTSAGGRAPRQRVVRGPSRAWRGRAHRRRSTG